MAIGYKLVGGVHEGVARSVSVFFSMIMLFWLYLFIRRLGGERGERLALYGLIFAALSPQLVALSRSIQPDIIMVSASVGALYMFYRYQETRGIHYYIFSAALMTFAVLTKVFALYLFLPVIYIAWMYQGKTFMKDTKNYLYAFIVSLALLWYAYMWYLGNTLDLFYEPYQLERGEMHVHHSYWKLFSWSSLQFPLKIFFVHILTPLGALCFAAGVISKKLDKKHGLMVMWLLSVVIYLLVMWPVAVYHPYYQLPLIPVLSYFVALGADRFLRNSHMVRLCKSPLLLLPILVIQIWWLAYFYRLLYFIPPARQAIVRTGELADALIPKESLIIASWGGSPIQLYYTHRKGWVLNVANPDTTSLMKQVESNRQEGATWFVTSKTDEIPRNKDFEAYLRNRYKVAYEDQTTLVLDLRKILP